jgi:plastocyanin
VRRYVAIGAAATLLAIPPLALGRATTTVTVGPPGATTTFAPKTVTQAVGAGSIHWYWWRAPGSSPGPHNVRQDDKLFYSGEPTNDNPAGYTITPSAGRFHYYCEPHRLRGMEGTIYIRPAVFSRTATSFGVRWSPGTNQTGNRFDVRYRIDGGAWKTWKNHIAAAQGVFGVSDNPVHVSPRHKYEVQARSETSTDLQKRSGWSPSARVTT